MTEVVAPPLIQFADPVPINILVVDDEPAFCAVVCEILRIYGFAAYPANGVPQALELMKGKKLHRMLMVTFMLCVILHLLVLELKTFLL